MLWFYASLVAAVGFASNVLISKHVMKNTSSLNFATVYSILGAVFSLPLLIYLIATRGVSFNLLSLLALLTAGLANTAAFLAITKAVKTGEISLAYPLSRTEPVFAFLIGVVLLGEIITFQKILGILLASIGGYVLILNNDYSLVEPLKHLDDSLSAQLGLLSAALYSFAAIADKFAVKTMNPLTYSLILLQIVMIFYAVFIALRTDKDVKSLFKTEVKRNTYSYIVAGVFLVLTYFSFVKALSLTEASRVVSVMQIELLLAVIGGYLFFDEKEVGRKLTGSVLLAAGVLLVVIENLIVI